MVNRTIPSKLTAIQVENAKPKDSPYKLSDGGGLFLLVRPNGRKYWRLKYRFDGKEKTLAIGIYDLMSLAEARQKTFDAKKELSEGKNPTREKKLRKLKKQNNLFSDVAEAWWNKQRGAWTEEHANRVWSSIENEIIPALGDLAVYEITTPECLAVIQKVEKRGALDVASRVKQRMISIFNYAIQLGKTKINPVVSLTDVIKVRKTKHMKALSSKDFPQFLRDLDSSVNVTDVVRNGLKLITLTFVRPGEIRYAEWKDIDLDEKEWRIPAEKTKMKREHVVPLSKQAIAVLDTMKKISGELDYIFPGYRNHTNPISENALTYGIRKSLGYDGTAHGMRTVASTTLNENNFHPDVIERQLAHIEQNKVRAAYNKYEYIKERVKMMKWWGNYIDKQTKKGKSLKHS